MIICYKTLQQFKILKLGYTLKCQVLNQFFYLCLVYHGALYMMYSINHPAVRNYQNNACFYVKGEDLMLGTRCQYFIAHVPGFARDAGSISLESYCKRDYFLRQKKYGFILAKAHESLNFGKYATRSSDIINTLITFNNYSTIARWI